MKSSLTHIAGVETLQVLGEKNDVGVIFLHGYGANMHDLFPLWEMWHEEGFNWYFPNGVNPLPMGHYEGRAWFSIDMEKLEESIRNGTQRDMKGSIPPEFDDTLSQLESLITEVSKKHKKIIVGGFSQGAMCAFHLGLKSHLGIDALILLSGALLAEAKIPATSKSLPFYQSHGTGDPILSILGAQDLEAKLKSLNFSGSLHSFPGGHEIPSSVIQGVKNFLKSLD